MSFLATFCAVALLLVLASAEAELRVLLSVATRRRFWLHALSTLSLLESLRNASLASDVVFEWHVLDDASDHPEKDTLLRDLADRGLLHNYSKLPLHTGTIGVLRHFVDVVLERADLDYWLHCDDDVLLGPSTLLRAVRDYQRDLARHGGLLAIFVNSWLDEQLRPAFGPYATAPFLGGAAYIVNRETLLSTGNPWALAQERGLSPHDAHVLWLTKLLPERGLRIWVRWEEPYQCQHLGNVRTLNFGRRPEWEPMWALDHRTQRLVEVDGYNSAELRAALWAGGAMLRAYVAARNEHAAVGVRLPLRRRKWSAWDYATLRANYIEIGTSDFDTLAQRHSWREDVVGFSVEPVRTYFEKLPRGKNKLVLNMAVSDHDGYEHVFFVRPELIEGYMGADDLCQRGLLAQVGLKQCLPGWMRGASSIKKWPEGVRQSVSDIAPLLATVHVPALTYATLMTIHGIAAVDIVKIDTEGFDHVILRQVVDFGVLRGVWPWQIQFEKNSLSDWQALDAQVQRLQGEFQYSCRMTDMESAACWRADAMP